MAFDNRDPKIVASVPCPTCLAPIGTECVGLISTHMTRRRAWQALRGPVPVPPPVICASCGHGSRRHARKEAGCDCGCPITRADIVRPLA